MDHVACSLIYTVYITGLFFVEIKRKCMNALFEREECDCFDVLKTVLNHNVWDLAKFHPVIDVTLYLAHSMLRMKMPLKWWGFIVGVERVLGTSMLAFSLNVSRCFFFHYRMRRVVSGQGGFLFVTLQRYSCVWIGLHSIAV